MSEMTETIEDVQRRLEDGVLWITLNRPDAGNAMTVSMRNQIIEWLEHASVDDSVRAVVLTGQRREGLLHRRRPPRGAPAAGAAARARPA